MMLKTVMEVAQYYIVFNYGPPIPQKYLNTQDRTIVSGPGMNPEPIFFSQGTAKRNLGIKPTQMR